MRLSDTIEQFIKITLMQEASEVELKRNELAEYFRCAPSQINYVLSTRFTPAHGYLIESHRGGGGCIRIYRVVEEDMSPLRQVEGELGDTLDEMTAMHLIAQLVEREAVTAEQAIPMRAAVSGKALSVPIPQEAKDVLRARIMRQMLQSLIKAESAAAGMPSAML